LAGVLALGEDLAGAVVALMLSGGNALEPAAGRRARGSLTALLERARRIARRRGERLEDVPVDEIAVVDDVVVSASVIVPVDGAVESDEALVGESTLTGEAFPGPYRRGKVVRSGSSNVGEPFELRAVPAAADSAYAALVRLVAHVHERRDERPLVPAHHVLARRELQRDRFVQAAVGREEPAEATAARAGVELASGSFST
jgi:cation transport ATPase